MGFEPTTSAVTGRRSNQLSHQAKSLITVPPKPHTKTLKYQSSDNHIILVNNFPLYLTFGQALDLLVSVSYTHYCASTSDLSTS